MKIESIRILNGANIYSHQPAIVAHLDLNDLHGRESRTVKGFNERLLNLLPRLIEHYCSARQMGGFVERLHDGTHFNHVVEHIAMELLSEAGFDARSKKNCRGDESDDSKAVIETTAVETTRYIFPLALDVARSIVEEKSFEIEEKFIQAKKIAADYELGPSSRAIVEAAEKRGIPWTRENDYSLVQLGYGKNLHFIQAALTDKTSNIGVDIAGDKDWTKQRLRKFSIPVPDGEIVRSEAEAITAFKEIGAPVVVKPLDGRQGKGVSLNLKTPEEVINAFNTAREFSSKVLVEELFEGKNYRVLIVGGKMVAASERLPCHIKGDGARSIGELIAIENRNPMRGEGHEKPLTRIKITPVLLAAMQQEGWKLEDVPAKDEMVLLCGGMNLSTGGTAKDVTDEVHPTVRNLCERAARIINLDICGVDLVLENISSPMPKNKGGVIELNAAPGLRMHQFPSEGKARDVGGAIVEWLYPHGREARIPIITITGTNGKTTVTRMISHILLQTGWQVGMTTTDGIYLNGEEITSGDTTGPISAKTVLGDRSVDIAVLETARGGIVRRGLGYDWSDIAVITNISEDHIGQDGIKTVDDIINIKALVAERLRAGGTLIVNADDANSLRVLERERVKTPARKIVFFSLDEKNERVREHLASGGTAYFRSGDSLVEAKGKSLYTLACVNSIQATMNGAAEFQIANALAAIAAARAHGLSAKSISRLETFRGDANNPGRSNLYKVGRGYALIDYGHNAGAFSAICKMAALWRGKTVTGIIGVPGDRDDAIIADAGRIAAQGFHKVIIKEDRDLRGRASGEVARLLCETVTRSAPDRSCEIVLDEIAAFENALQTLCETDVVVLFYDKLAPVIEILEKYKAAPVESFENADAKSSVSAF